MSSLLQKQRQQLKLITCFFDFDDTIYVPEFPETTKLNIEAIDRLRQRGYIVVVITARSYACLLMNMPDVPRHFDYIVANDGAVIYKIDGTTTPLVLYEDAMEDRLINRFQSKLKSLPIGEHAIVNYSGEKELDGIQPATRIYKIRYWTKDKRDGDAIYNLVRSEFKKELSAFIYPEVPYYRHHDISRLPWIVDPALNTAVDIYNVNTNKRTAVNWLLEYIEPQLPNNAAIYTVAAGDHYNDIEMLCNVDRSFVMEKGRKEVKALSGIQIVPNLHTAIDSVLNSENIVP